MFFKVCVYLFICFLLPISFVFRSYKSAYAQSLPTLENTESIKITVKKFKFVGNTVFSTKELEEVTKPFINKPLSWSDLLEARSVITQLYVNQGYITSGAYISPQEVLDGVITINILEGTLADVQINGLRRLHQDYIRDRLILAAGKPLNINRLLLGLQLLQLNPLIDKISAELLAFGVGQSSLQVEVTEAKSFTASVTLDNGRSPSVGRFERMAELSSGNVFGFGDRLTGVYKNTDGSNEVQLAYTLPFNASNGTVSLNYTTSSSWVIQSPFESLNLTSFYQSYEITLRQPIIETPNQEFAIGLTAQRQESQNFLLSIPFALTSGADATGQIRLSTLRFFQEYSQRTNKEVLAARSEFSLGLDAFNPTVELQIFSPQYFIWRGQLQWLRLVDMDNLFLARVNFQLSNNSLVSLEQFGLGGVDSVRGYNPNVKLTDSGVSASFEWRFPVLQKPQQNMVLQIAPFVDVATGWNYNSSDDFTSNTLVSTGVGLIYQIGDRFNARLDLGIPLVKLRSNMVDNPVYFSIFYRF